MQTQTVITIPSVEQAKPEEEWGKWIVRETYKALKTRDVETIHRLLAADIEWSFHGPPSHQHMMRVLTGSVTDLSVSSPPFVFNPESVSSIGGFVIVEGQDKLRDVCWVHVWTVGRNGVITQVREYFNTSLTIVRLEEIKGGRLNNNLYRRGCLELWRSKIAGYGWSIPEIILAI